VSSDLGDDTAAGVTSDLNMHARDILRQDKWAMLYSSRSLFYLDWRARGWQFCVSQINRIGRPLTANLWQDRDGSKYTYNPLMRAGYEKKRDTFDQKMGQGLYNRTIGPQLLFDTPQRDIEQQYGIKERYQNRFFWKHYAYVQMNRKAQKRCNVVKVYSEFIWKTLLRLRGDLPDSDPNTCANLDKVLAKIAEATQDEEKRTEFYTATKGVVDFLKTFNDTMRKHGNHHYVKVSDLKNCKKGRKFLKEIWWPFMRKHVTVVFGNWRSTQKKGTFKPTPSLDFYLRAFKERQIVCFIIDEFRTSRVCHHCLLLRFNWTTRKFAGEPVPKPP
jgi:hypothetical protein